MPAAAGNPATSERNVIASPSLSQGRFSAASLGRYPLNASSSLSHTSLIVG